MCIRYILWYMQRWYEGLLQAATIAVPGTTGVVATSWEDSEIVFTSLEGPLNQVVVRSPETGENFGVEVPFVGGVFEVRFPGGSAMLTRGDLGQITSSSPIPADVTGFVETVLTAPGCGFPTAAARTTELRLKAVIKQGIKNFLNL